MKSFATLLIIICFNAFQSFSQSALTIINTENKKITFSFKDLQLLPQTTLHVNAEDGTPHNYTGVEIQMLLGKAGVFVGKDAKRKTLDSYMFIKASDNYSVVYALSEIDSAFSDKKMILATTKDNKPLPQNFGPLQIIATGEKKHARLIRQVMEIDIRKAE